MTRSRAIQRLRGRSSARSLAVVADDDLGAQLDAERRQPLGNEQRVGVEPRRSEQLAADGDDLGGAQRRAPVMRSSRAAATSPRAATRFAYTAAIASSAITPRPPCSCSSRPAGYGLITSKMRKRTNPAIAPGQPTGMNASVISMPDDFVDHDRARDRCRRNIARRSCRPTRRRRTAPRSSATSTAGDCAHQTSR